MNKIVCNLTVHDTLPEQPILCLSARAVAHSLSQISKLVWQVTGHNIDKEDCNYSIDNFFNWNWQALKGKFCSCMDEIAETNR